jgi:hypothetical protein
VDDRTIRIAIVVIGHVMWLSTAALRFLRSDRAPAASRRSWLIQLYQYLVWIPLVLATFFATGQFEIGQTWQLAGVAMALAGSLLAAWAMWTSRRYPKYVGILDYHVGAALALESVALIVATALIVVPYTALRALADRRTATSRAA